MKTSTQQKAIQPLGDWTQAPETPVVMPLQEDVNPITGQPVPPESKWAVLFKGGPPPSCPSLALPPGVGYVKTSERHANGLPIIEIDASRLAHLRTEVNIPAARAAARMAAKAAAVVETLPKMVGKVRSKPCGCRYQFEDQVKGTARCALKPCPAGELCQVVADLRANAKRMSYHVVIVSEIEYDDGVEPEQATPAEEEFFAGKTDEEIAAMAARWRLGGEP